MDSGDAPAMDVDGESPLSYNYPFECQFCECTYKSLQNYTAHMVLHASLDNSYRCSKCERAFVCAEELNLHMRVHDGLKPYKCKVCDQQYSFAKSLEYHLQSHGGVKLFQCHHCGMSFLHLHDMNEHLSDHKMGRVELNQIANRATEPEEAMEDEDDPMDELMERPIQSQVEVTHSIVQQPPVAVSQPKPLDEVKFKVETDLPVALPNGTAITAIAKAAPDEEAVYTQAVNLKRIFCNMCHKKMANKKSLNTHYKTVHMKNIHSCSMCRTSFLFARLLKEHIAKRKRVISCQYCDLKFCSNKRYSSHMQKLHAGQLAALQAGRAVNNAIGNSGPATKVVANASASKFPCNDCGKVFLSLKFLQSHREKRRNPNFPYECDECKHRFSKMAMLTEHKTYHLNGSAKRMARSIIATTPTTNNNSNNNKKKNNGQQQGTAVDLQLKVKRMVSDGRANEPPKISYDEHIIRLSESLFKCNLCYRTFKAVNHLKCHLRYAHLQKSYHCRQCKMQFPHYKMFVNHVRDYRKCGVCTVRFCSKVVDLADHVDKCRREHATELTVESQTTGGRQANTSLSVSRRSASMHPVVTIVDDDEIEDLVEDYAEESWRQQQQQPPPDSSSLMETAEDQEPSDYPSIPAFLMDDLEPNEFKCELCEKIFSKITSLHLHSFTHDMEKEMRCLFCNFLFLQRSSLNRHYRCRNTIHTCKTCNESFCSNFSLKQHTCTVDSHNMDREHLAGSANMAADDEFLMSNGADEDEDMGRLPRTRTKSARQADSVAAAQSKDENNSGLLHQQQLQLLDESDTDFESFMCMMCGAPFTNKVDMDQHVQTSHGTETKCNVCNKVFRSPTILQIHMAARASRKNRIKCPDCSHRFSKQSEFRKHYMYHTMRLSRPNASDEAIYSRIASRRN